MSQHEHGRPQFRTISEPQRRTKPWDLTVDDVVSYLEERQKSVDAVIEGRPFNQRAKARAEVLETTLNWIATQRGRR